MKKTKINSWQMLSKNIAFTFVVVILFFGILEIGCRILNLEVNTGGPLQEEGILQFDVTNKKDQIDRDPFRETGARIHPLSQYDRAHFSNEREELTILSIGDSCVYGMGVNNDETFSYYLEEILNDERSAKKTRVFNFGWPGYSSAQGVAFLRKYIKEIRPNIIIAWFGTNDCCYAPFFTDAEYSRKKDNAFLIKAHNYMYSNFTFYRILKNINLRYARRLVDGSFKNPLKGNFGKQRVSPKEFRQNLTEMKHIARDNHCEIILIWHCGYYEGILQKRTEYAPSPPYFDICDIYSSSGEEPAALFADAVHPSEKGHKIIAQALAEVVRDKRRNGIL